jgi:hypothetical protein
MANGIKIVLMKWTKHIPSYITTARHSDLISYEGQPQTCYGCGDKNHMYHACPKRRGVQKWTETPITNTWTQIVSATAPISETTNSTSTDKQLAAIPKQPEHTEEARTEIIEQTPVTYQKQNRGNIYNLRQENKTGSRPWFSSPVTMGRLPVDKRWDNYHRGINDNRHEHGRHNTRYNPDGQQ